MLCLQLLPFHWCSAKITCVETYDSVLDLEVRHFLDGLLSRGLAGELDDTRA
jgi:hypothetical protein